MRVRDVVKLLRVRQWVKNLLVFTGIIFAGELGNPALLLTALFTFLAFSIAASIVYILNDLRDREADAKHEKKKHRPLASGRVTPREAFLILTILILLLALLFSLLPWQAHAIITLYILLNLAYTFWLKHIPLLDVYSIATSFLLRVLAGTTGIGIPPSAWLILFFLFASLYFAFDKRAYELQSGALRRVFKTYSHAFLERMRLLTLSLLIITYTIYALFKQEGDAWFVLSSVLLTSLFMLHELNDRRGDFFEDVLISPAMILLALAWLATILLGLYTAWQPIHLTL